MTQLPDPTTPLHELVTPTALGNGEFSFCFPDGWQQGRGLFGGIVVAALVRAVQESLGEEGRPFRSITAELCGPTLPGPALVRTEVLRAGSGVSTVAARLIQEGEVQAHAVAVLGRSRTADADGSDLEAPALPPWQDVPVVEVQPPFGPHFARWFEFRNAGPIPFTAQQHLPNLGWIRPRFGPHRIDAAWVAACADAWWPVLLSQSRGPRPMATIAYTLQWLADPATLDPQQPLAFRARSIATADGYMVEFRELWTPDGRLVALNQQTIAVIK